MSSGVGVLRDARARWRATARACSRPSAAATSATRHRRVGDHQPAHRRHRAGRRRPRCARRPAGRTGARTSPTPTTSAGTSGSSRVWTTTACSSPTRSRAVIASDRDRGAGMSRRPASRRRARRGRARPGYVETLVRATVAEDLGGGVDVTTRGDRARRPRSARRTWCPRGRASSPGCPWRPRSSTSCRDGAREVEFGTADGARVAPRRRAAHRARPIRDLLTAERTALNLLCHLSGVATADRAVGRRASQGTGARIRDTRKTTPGLRALEKYAVRCGGGVNHRMSLSDAALVKDNHVVAAGGVAAAFEPVRAASRAAGRGRGRHARPGSRGDRRRRRPRPARQHARPTRCASPSASPGARGTPARASCSRPRGGLTLDRRRGGRRDRRRLPLRRRAHPLRAGPRHRALDLRRNARTGT